MDSHYLTKFKGTIVLKDHLKPQAVDKIKELIQALGLEHIIFHDTKAQILYINGKIDNSSDIMERFISKIFKLINIEETTRIKAQGDDPKDRYDILIQSTGVYLQRYKLVPIDELILFAH